jgi:hypothetical protein
MRKRYRVKKAKKPSRKIQLRVRGLDFYTFVLPVADMEVFFRESAELGYGCPNDYMTAIIKGET